MQRKENNFAFIDSQNLNLSVRRLGWKLDFARFRIHLKEKYGVTKAYLFIGYIKTNAPLYENLRRDGYVLIFKPTLERKDGNIKENVDAELVLQVMIEYENFDRSVIVTVDGDFYCLIKYLLEKEKLGALIAPDRFRCSALLKYKIFRPYSHFLNELRTLLAYTKRRPYKDGTL